jgi:hypothetical protein
MAPKKTYYLVVRGRKPALYKQWHGAEGAAAQVEGFPNALYKGFARMNGFVHSRQGIRRWRNKSWQRQTW